MLRIFTTAADAAVEGTSDMELRQELSNLLRSSEPAFEGIDAVFPDDHAVVYAVSPEGALAFFKRTYSLTDGVVTLDGARVEVTPVMRYEPVAAAAAASTSCGCQSQSNQSATSASAEVTYTMHKNAERITSLIANTKTPWTEHDRAYLETVPDERLSTLEAAATVEPPAPVTKELTLADLPEAWRKAIEALAAVQATFTKADLEAMPADTLTKIAALASIIKPTTTSTVTSFAGRTPPAQRSAADAVPPPPDFNAAIRTAEQARRAR